MDDHDQRFKTLLRAFLPEFFALFFPDWAPRFDFTGTEWLDQEAFLDPPAGEKRILDVVAKVRNVVTSWPEKPAADHTIVHVEIESATGVAGVSARMYEYYTLLRRRHPLPVLPIAVYLRVGFDGIGFGVHEDRFAGWVALRFEHLYVGVPKMSGENLVTGTNPLGIALAALMKLPEENRAALKVAALKRINEIAGTEYRKMLLTDCIETYWPLTDDERAEYQRLIRSDENREVYAMLTMWDIRVMRQVLRKLTEKKFGPLSAEDVRRVEAVPFTELERTLENILTASTLTELGLPNAPPIDSNGHVGGGTP